MNRLLIAIVTAAAAMSLQAQNPVPAKPAAAAPSGSINFSQLGKATIPISTPSPAVIPIGPAPAKDTAKDKDTSRDANASKTDGGLPVRIKDVSRLKGDETYELVGYGVVTGLNNTGDSDKILIQQTLANMLQNFNIVVNPADLKAQNTAAVMVTATIRGNRREGDMVDAQVSAVGDCSSLTGGVLVMTPLVGADGESWGIAQGSVTTGGYSYGSKGAGGNQVTKNHPTTGMLTNGVKLLKNFGPDYNNDEVLTYILTNPDPTTAVNMAKAINRYYFGVATVQDSGVVKVRIPNKYRDENNVASFISEVGQLYFVSDTVAKVVFNERTGTIVIGHNVRISNAAVSHGNLYISVKNTEGVSQPGAFAPQGASTERMNDQTTDVKEKEARMFELQNTTTVGELVNSLNSLGVGARDIMIIFHVLKAAGSLHAELEAM